MQAVTLSIRGKDNFVSIAPTTIGISVGEKRIAGNGCVGYLFIHMLATALTSFVVVKKSQNIKRANICEVISIFRLSLLAK